MKLLNNIHGVYHAHAMNRTREIPFHVELAAMCPLSFFKGVKIKKTSMQPLTALGSHKMEASTRGNMDSLVKKDHAGYTHAG